MKKNYLTIAMIFFISGVYAQSNIHESGGNVGIGTTSPLERLTITNESPRALGIYRDLDVGAVGSASVFFNLGARSGSAFIPGAQIEGVLDNPASTGWMTFSTLNSDALSEKMRITKEGNVGIGTSTIDNVQNWNRVFQLNGSSHAKLLVTESSGVKVGIYSHTGYNGKIGTESNHNLTFMAGYWNDVMTLTTAGNVGIGTYAPNSKLAVNGNIRAHEIKVENANWPDYVFNKDYQLPTLQQTEQHIKEKGHLPGIPSAAEVKANGIDLGEMNAKLLQKIEELTLHLIQMKKENDIQQKINDDQNKVLHAEIKTLKSKQQ